jgi:hypothetical protein
LFPNTEVEHIMTEESDHMALLIHFENLLMWPIGRTNRGFWYEEMWTIHKNYEYMVGKAWENSFSAKDGIEGLWQWLQDVSRDMKCWIYDTFGSVRGELKILRNRLEEAKVQELVSGSSLEVREIEIRLHELYEREEIMYQQRSRQEWLKAGDHNTKYFHNRASCWKRKNTVKALRREDGSLCITNEGMLDMALAFYQPLYGTDGSRDSDHVLSLISCFVSNDMNRSLTCGFFRQGNWRGLILDVPYKGPQTGWAPSLFYQRHWPMLKGSVCKAVCDFLERKDFSEDFNDTVLVLIPKVNSPELIS